MAHKLPDLPYSYDALEPYYDEQTVRIHHDLHHKGYVDGLNKAEEALDRARVLFPAPLRPTKAIRSP
jgi:Fe-Mn family superoxide dismutase